VEYSQWSTRGGRTGSAYRAMYHRHGITAIRSIAWALASFDKLSTGLGTSYSVTACGLVACSRDPSLRSGQALREHVTGFPVPAGKKHPRVKSTRCPFCVALGGCFTPGSLRVQSCTRWHARPGTNPFWACLGLSGHSQRRQDVPDDAYTPSLAFTIATCLGCHCFRLAVYPLPTLALRSLITSLPP